MQLQYLVSNLVSSCWYVYQKLYLITNVMRSLLQIKQSYCTCSVQLISISGKNISLTTEVPTVGLHIVPVQSCVLAVKAVLDNKLYLITKAELDNKCYIWGLFCRLNRATCSVQLISISGKNISLIVLLRYLHTVPVQKFGSSGMCFKVNFLSPMINIKLVPVLELASKLTEH